MASTARNEGPSPFQAACSLHESESSCRRRPLRSSPPLLVPPPFAIRILWLLRERRKWSCLTFFPFPSSPAGLLAKPSIWSKNDRDGEARTRKPASLGSSWHAYNTKGILAFQHSLERSCIQNFQNFCSLKSNGSMIRNPHFWSASKEAIKGNWLCHCDISASSDQDYRSSRNIAISLFKRYRNVIDRGGGDNLKEFISAGVNAYALGCTDEGLRKELINIKDSGVEIEGLQADWGGTTVKLEILTEEVHECILWLSIVFITILCMPPPTVVRWSSTPPVSAETMHQWKGFCAIIANAYYMRGMAWLPVKTLQLEQMAVMGSAEEPSIVASRMRLAFSTLEEVSPQWPRV